MQMHNISIRIIDQVWPFRWQDGWRVKDRIVGTQARCEYVTNLGTGKGYGLPQLAASARNQRVNQRSQVNEHLRVFAHNCKNLMHTIGGYRGSTLMIE
jgi:hypothetical protein